MKLPEIKNFDGWSFKILHVRENVDAYQQYADCNIDENVRLIYIVIKAEKNGQLAHFYYDNFDNNKEDDWILVEIDTDEDIDENSAIINHLNQFFKKNGHFEFWKFTE